MRNFFLLFLVFPLIELFVLIRVGASIGASATLLLVLAGGVLGVLCMRLAGLTTALKVRERMAQGEVPNKDMLNGLLLAVGGGLIFLPGCISDVIGLLCLLPFVRQWLIQRVAQYMEHSAARSREYYARSTTYTKHHGYSETRETHVIEGEYERKDQ